MRKKALPNRIRLLVPPNAPKPEKYFQLIQVEADKKTSKGSKFGYLTGILYLAPSNESGVLNTCTSASLQCRKLCLFGSGMARVFPRVKKSRIAKTRMLVNERERFIASLRYDIVRLVYTAQVYGFIPAVRLNGTSDLPWLSQMFAREFPDVQFYDYTKHAKPWQRTLPNYHITFSHSESNLEQCFEALHRGINVAVVFDSPSEIKGRRDAGPLPGTWHGYRVIDGDVSDLRFLDETGVIIGIRMKSVNRNYRASANGFVQTIRQSQLVTLQPITAIA